MFMCTNKYQLCDNHRQFYAHIEKKAWQKAKLSLINVSFGNTSESAVRINLLDLIWLIKICQFFVIYHLQTQFSRPILLLRSWD